MAEIIACLARGKLLLLCPGHPAEPLVTPLLERLGTGALEPAATRVIGISRGRRDGELCYAIQEQGATSVYAVTLGTRQEKRLFRGVAANFSEIHLSVADEALACTVSGERDASWLGVLADDGKGLRTVTEGDVIDRSPRWAPGGRAELVYASAGIGRARSGAWAGRSPFALHRLRFADNSVEVLVSDAKYDYFAPVPVSPALLYAVRRSYQPPRARPLVARIAQFFAGGRGRPSATDSAAIGSGDLVRITPQRSQVVATDVVAFDAVGGVLVYANGAAVLRAEGEQATQFEVVGELAGVEELVIVPAGELPTRPS